MTLVIDPAPLDVLTEAQNELISKLASQLAFDRFQFEIQNAYYEGTMRIANLGISIPPQLSRLRSVVGWPRVIIDSIDERLDVEGFRLSDGLDADTDLWNIWQTNNLDEESQLAHLDALIYGSAYITVGAGDEVGDQPIIAVESPLDLVCLWDARTRSVMAAFRDYSVGHFGLDRVRYGTLYLPDSTISLMMEQGSSQWQIIDRDDHNLGTVPVVRMTNRARITDRQGRSEITPEIISLTDEACRTMLGLSVSREFYAAPQRYILGASESSFVGADGTAKTAWETYLGKVLALERDEDGNVPTVGQFTPYTPEAFTKVLDAYAKIMTSLTGLPAEYLGITTSNPSSADAIRMNSDRLVNKVRRKQRSFEAAWEQAMRIALLIRDGTVQDDALSMETLWRNPEIPTPAATADAIAKEIQTGSVPPTSDVILERLGYSALERRRLAADRERDQGAALLAELASSLLAKEARVDKTISADILGTETVQGTGGATGVPSTSAATPVATPAPTPAKK